MEDENRCPLCNWLNPTLRTWDVHGPLKPGDLGVCEGCGTGIRVDSERRYQRIGGIDFARLDDDQRDALNRTRREVLNMIARE